ncbi:MAG: hypothetical protein U0K51_16010 [Segatella copri]|nr:hypothetical protein [Segatella copri]
MDSLVKGPSEVAESITQMTRSISPDSIYDGEPVEFEPTQDMIRLKELYAEMHSTQRRAPLNPSSTYDETLWGNMYAIRELPATIKVRSKASTGSTANYVSLYCEGKSKEVTLNAGNAGDKNRFLIKVLPASAGVPYLIYSVAAGTPLSVGYYTNKPDEKILMASKDDSGSLMSIGWDLLQSSYYKNYYAIQSESYLGQADPNNQWSIFYYVLEAVSGNKIRYAQHVNNKAQQEFIITPDAKFEIKSLEYVVNNSTPSKSTFSKTVTVKNTSAQEKAMNVPFDFYEMETSYFNRNSWNVNLNFTDDSKKFVRPTVTSGSVITDNPDAAEDAVFINSNTQNISRHIVYNHPIRCKASSTAKVTVKFVKYYVNVDYIVKAQYEVKAGDLRECVLKGTWSGYVIEDPNEITPEDKIEFTPIGGGDIILKKSRTSNQS